MAKLTLSQETKDQLTAGADDYLALVKAAAAAIQGTAREQRDFAVTLMDYQDKARAHKEVIGNL